MYIPWIPPFLIPQLRTGEAQSARSDGGQAQGHVALCARQGARFGWNRMGMGSELWKNLAEVGFDQWI